MLGCKSLHLHLRARRRTTSNKGNSGQRPSTGRTHFEKVVVNLLGARWVMITRDWSEFELFRAHCDV